MHDTHHVYAAERKVVATQRLHETDRGVDGTNADRSAGAARSIPAAAQRCAKGARIDGDDPGRSTINGAVCRCRQTVHVRQVRHGRSAGPAFVTPLPNSTTLTDVTDHAVRREEPLRLGRGREPLHLPFSSSSRVMRVLSTIVQIPARPMPNIGQNLPMCDTVAAQAVGNEAPRFVLQSVQQPLEKRLAAEAFPAILHEDVEYDPVLVYYAPQIVQHAVDPEERLVEMPGIAWSRPPPAQFISEAPAELQATSADASWSPGRKLFALAALAKSPLAIEAVRRIDALSAT